MINHEWGKDWEVIQQVEHICGHETVFIYSRFDIRFTGVFSKIDSKSSLYSEIWLNWTLSNLEFCINQTLIKALM